MDEVLELQFRLFRGTVGQEILLMDDSAWPHQANVVPEYLEAEDITRVAWQPYLPDFNPIDHVWDALGRRILARHIPPRTLEELKSALLEEWRSVPQDLINTLVKSMKTRVRYVFFSEVTIHPIFHKIIQIFRKRDLIFPSFCNFRKFGLNFNILRISNSQTL